VFEQKGSRQIHGMDALAELEGTSCVLNIRTYPRTNQKPRVTKVGTRNCKSDPNLPRTDHESEVGWRFALIPSP